MTHKLGIRNYELGIPSLPPRDLDDGGGRVAFLIPNSSFLIQNLGGWK